LMAEVVHAVGEPIGIIGEKGEDITEILEEAAAPSAPAPVPPSEPSATGPAGTAQSAPGGTVSKAAAAGGEHIKSSPLARALADQSGIDIGSVHGTGPDGRVVKRDVEKAARRAGAAGGTHGPAGGGLPSESRPITQKRRIIARRLSESKFQAPHYYLRTAVEMDTLLAERSIANSSREGKISLNAFLIKLSAETLKGYPQLRTSWQEDALLVYNRIDIGIAVAQEDGLITPVVRDCGNKGITAIDAELRDLIDRARKNKLTPDEYTTAVFTISNLGGYDIEEFTAIINPPGSAILAVGTITREPRVRESGGDEKVEIMSVMRCTLSCDHRVVDGAVGAAFLTGLKRNLEHPIMTLN
ncbi:MAG: dihydrolipoamide acetyltransferase family protein, partial [Spirochaetia bacterium]